MFQARFKISNVDTYPEFLHWFLHCASSFHLANIALKAPLRFLNASEVKEAPWTAAIFLGILVSTLASHGDVNWPKGIHNCQDECR